MKPVAKQLIVDISRNPADRVKVNRNFKILNHFVDWFFTALAKLLTEGNRVIASDEKDVACDEKDVVSD